MAALTQRPEVSSLYQACTSSQKTARIVAKVTPSCTAADQPARLGIKGQTLRGTCLEGGVLLREELGGVGGVRLDVLCARCVPVSEGRAQAAARAGRAREAHRLAAVFLQLLLQVLPQLHSEHVSQHGEHVGELASAHRIWPN